MKSPLAPSHQPMNRDAMQNIAYRDTEPCAVAVKKTAVQFEIDRLNQAVSNMVDQVDMLRDRLSPALQSERPMPATPKGEEAITSHIQGCLADIAERIHIATARLADTRERLDI